MDGASLGIGIFALLFDLYSKCRNGAESLHHVQCDLESLTKTLKLLDRDLPRGSDFEDIREVCSCIATDIQQLLSKHSALETARGLKKAWYQLMWNLEDGNIAQLRLRLSTQIAMLSARSSSASHRRLDPTIYIPENSSIATQATISVSEDVDQIWKGLHQVSKRPNTQEGAFNARSIILEASTTLAPSLVLAMDSVTSPSQESLSDTYKFPIESSNETRNSVYSLSSIESSDSVKGNKRRFSIFHFTPSQRFIAAAKAANFHKLMEYRNQMDQYTLYKALMAVVRLEVVSHQHLPIVTSLLTGPISASPNDKDPIEERTPLIWSIIRNNVGFVETIIQYGACVEEIDGKEKLTPLMWAAYQRADRIAEILVSNHASYTTKDETFRRTPLLWAAESGCVRICRLLLEIDRSLINARDKNGMSPLALAYLGNHIDAARVFVQYGDDCNFTFPDGQTLLIRAIDKANDAEFVKLLVENDANILARSPEYIPTFMLAVHGGDNGIVPTLLANKPNLEAIDKNGRTALMYAILCNNFHLVELLLAHGAKASCTDNRGVTIRRAAEQAPDKRIKRILGQISQDGGTGWVLKAELPG